VRGSNKVVSTDFSAKYSSTDTGEGIYETTQNFHTPFATRIQLNLAEFPNLDAEQISSSTLIAIFVTTRSTLFHAQIAKALQTRHLPTTAALHILQKLVRMENEVQDPPQHQLQALAIAVAHRPNPVQKDWAPLQLAACMIDKSSHALVGDPFNGVDDVGVTNYKGFSRAWIDAIWSMDNHKKVGMEIV
jgi:hypothetical protein